MQKTVAVLGAGNMGTAVAQVLADNEYLVKIWNWEGDLEPLKQIEKFAENKKYLPGFKLSKNIKPCYKIAEAVENAKIIFFVVPSGVMEHTISFAARSIPAKAILVDVSKGVEPNSLCLLTEVIKKHVDAGLKKNIVTISGPAIARQIMERKFTAMNIASKNNLAMQEVIKAVQNSYVKLIPTNDVIGVEIGGSFKNVYAIAMGMCDSLGYALNTKAVLIVKALDEIANLTSAMGGKRHTAYELAGLGDLIGTSLCDESRNRTFGEYLGKGLKPGVALKRVGQTVEGVSAVHCLKRLGEKYKINLPFANMVYDCVQLGNVKTKLNKYLDTKIT